MESVEHPKGIESISGIGLQYFRNDVRFLRAAQFQTENAVIADIAEGFANGHEVAITRKERHMHILAKTVIVNVSTLDIFAKESDLVGLLGTKGDVSVTEVPAYRNMRISEVIHQRGEVTVITCIKWPFGMVGKVRGGG